MTPLDIGLGIAIGVGIIIAGFIVLAIIAGWIDDH